eukprot:495535-Pelagomonas_calceolata.AAC.2
MCGTHVVGLTGGSETVASSSVTQSYFDLWQLVGLTGGTETEACIFCDTILIHDIALIQGPRRSCCTIVRTPKH